MIAAHIIDDRALQVAYVKREKPFDNLMRHVGQRIKAGETLPHRLVPLLVKQYKLISTFASHADVNSFVHRIRTTREDGKITWMGVEYFQFSHDDAARKSQAFAIFHTFVMALDIFADFLVLEKKAVPEQWKEDLHKLGAQLQVRARGLKAEARPDGGTSES